MLRPRRWYYVIGHLAETFDPNREGDVGLAYLCAHCVSQHQNDHTHLLWWAGDSDDEETCWQCGKN